MDILQVVQFMIFLSYSCISIIVFFIFFKSRKYYHNKFKPNFLVITYGLFFMLCAITHLLPSDSSLFSFFLVLCMIDSLLAAGTTIYLRSPILEYLSLVSRTNYIKNETILGLLEGYDMKVSCSNGVIISGEIKNISNPIGMEIHGHIENGNNVEIGDFIYKVAYFSTDVLLNENEEYVEPNNTILLYGRDVTHEVKEINSREKLLKSRMNLCLSTAHDIRTPMFTVKVLCDNICQRMNIPLDIRNSLDEMAINIELLDTICSEMMDTGRLLSGETMNHTLTSISILDTVERIEIISKYINSKNLYIFFEISHDFPQRVISDKGWIFQIILNFVTNAIKYTEYGHIRINISYVNEHMEIIVSDTGIGIHDSQKELVFQSFHTVNESVDTGKGIGLYSVATKVGILNGTCGVRDNDPHGSVFWCSIPCEKGRNSLNDGDMSVKSILVVDDLPIARKIINRALSYHNVEERTNGKEALEAMIDKEYDLVLMDIGMPIMDGLDATIKFRKLEHTLNRDKRQMIACISATYDNPGGIFDYILGKPIDFKFLEYILTSDITE